MAQIGANAANTALYCSLLLPCYTPLPHSPWVHPVSHAGTSSISTAVHAAPGAGTEIKHRTELGSLRLLSRKRSRWRGVEVLVCFDRPLMRLVFLFSSGHIPLDWIELDRGSKGTCASRGETDVSIKQPLFAIFPLSATSDSSLCDTPIPLSATPRRPEPKQRQIEQNRSQSSGK